MSGVFIVGGILTGLLFGGGAGAIASAKGRSFFGYFLLGFFFSLVGLLIAIGMPSLIAPAGAAFSSQREAEKELANAGMQAEPIAEPDDAASVLQAEKIERVVRVLLVIVIASALGTVVYVMWGIK